MNELTLTTGSDANGIKTILVECRFLRIVVLPEAGAKIWQIHHKPLDVEIMWINPCVPAARHAINAPYDDAWTGNWHAERFERAVDVGVHLRLTTPISNFLVERTLLSCGDRPSFEIQCRFTNQGERDLSVPLEAAPRIRHL